MGGNSFKLISTAIVLVLSTIVLSAPAFASISLNVSTTPVVQSSVAGGVASSSILITGSIVNTTASDNITFINVSASISNNFYSTLTLNNGSFSFNVTAPTVAGEYALNVTTNHSSLPSKRFGIFVSNATSGSINFIGGKTPPFTNGTTFTLNVTLNNGTSALANYTPRVHIYQANGQNVSWTVTNVGSTQTNNSGSIAYNITVPADATMGEYGISIDFGRAFSIFSVGSTFQIAVNTLTSNDEVTPSFTPGSNVTILSKLRASGNPVTGATVTALITYPNGTTTKNITLSAHPSSEGFYNNTFTTESGLRGTYTVKVGALKSGNDITGSTTFSTSTFSGRIEPVKDAFFFEWGGKSAFKPGESISLNLVPINLTNGETINWNACTGGNYTFVSITFVNGVNTTLGNASVTLGTEQYLPSVNVCKVTFKAPADSGTYNIRYNVTFGTETKTLEGFFSVSNHFLKVTPVLDVGGFEGFHTVFAPGTNVTLTLKAINVSGNVETKNISSQTITKIVPLEFISGASEVTTITQSSMDGRGTSDPNITFTLPTTIQGPVLIEVSSTVNSSKNGTAFISESVTGTAFIISNYLEGFLGPQKGESLSTREGESSGGFNADAQCSGTQRFTGRITDVNTSTAAQGATVIGIIQAREEETGKDVSSFLSIAGTTASDSSGSLTVNVTYSPSGGYSFSGNYFVIFNASYKGKTTGIPSFFTCRTLNIGFPLMRVLGSDQQFSWQISPTSALNVTLTNVTHMNGSVLGSTSVFSITQIFNFNPSAGTMQVLKNNTPMQVRFTASSTYNKANLTLYPENYSISGVALTKWPNGFFDLRPRVASDFGTDTGFGGFMVVSFDAFTENFGFGQVAAGSVQSMVINVRANAGNGTSNNNYVKTSSFDNNTAFTIKMGRPWEGSLVTLTNVNATKLSDNFGNSTYDNVTFERWNVTYAVPSTLSKGGTMVTVTVNGTAGNMTNSLSSFDTVDVPLFVSVTKFNIVLPFEEMIGDPTYSPMDAYFVKSDNAPGHPDSVSTATYQWNLTNFTLLTGINSTSGRVCIKNEFNVTRITQQGQQALNINGTGTRMLILDSKTAGVYDTVLLNRSNTITILNVSSLNARSIGSQAYLWEIRECGFLTIVNASMSAIQSQGSFISNTNGGAHQAGTYFTVPYVVFSGGVAQSSVPINVKSVAKQDNRGFGFEGKLATSQFNSSGATTNADGIGFVNVSVGSSGRFIMFWTTTVASETDSADMSTATTLEIKGFSTSAQSITSLTSGKMTLMNDTFNRTGLVGLAPNNRILNATLTESSDGDFVSNGVADSWTVAFNASNNRTRIVNTTASSVIWAIPTSFFYNETITTLINVGSSVSASNTRLKLSEWTNSSNNITAVFYTDASGSPGRYSVSSAAENVTSLICAQGFEKPTAIPVENATVNVSVTDWSSFPPAVKYLDIFKISDGSKGSQSNPIVTSPVGCVLVRIGPGQLGSWPSASAGKPPVFIEGTVTKTGGSSEFVYVGDVFRP